MVPGRRKIVLSVVDIEVNPSQSLKSTPFNQKETSRSTYHTQRTIIDRSQEAKVNINLHYSSCGKVTNAGIHVRLQCEELCRSRR